MLSVSEAMMIVSVDKGMVLTQTVVTSVLRSRHSSRNIKSCGMYSRHLNLMIYIHGHRYDIFFLVYRSKKKYNLRFST
jgi:hypothetical protein